MNCKIIISFVEFYDPFQVVYQKLLLFLEHLMSFVIHGYINVKFYDKFNEGCDFRIL